MQSEPAIPLSHSSLLELYLTQTASKRSRAPCSRVEQRFRKRNGIGCKKNLFEMTLGLSGVRIRRQ
jgi:hypothetical protein